MEQLIKRFDEIHIDDVGLVGGKNASLGEMYSTLRAEGVNIPDGFAVTAAGYWLFIDRNDLRSRLNGLMLQLDKKTFSNLRDIGLAARELIMKGRMPGELSTSVLAAYQRLSGDIPADVAVRSSATAEDLPDASFAGQHESFLNINGDEQLLKSVQLCFASLYTDRAIKYREDKSFDHSKIALSVGIQRMVRSDKASSGIGFTLEPESGFRNIIHLSGVWGLGENIVQGTVTPDQFFVFKPTLISGKNAIIQKQLGAKEKMMVYGDRAGTGNSTVNLVTPENKRHQFVLSDTEITRLSKWAMLIEEHYGKPMDIEWAKDGFTGELFIIQARPETVHSRKNPLIVQDYQLLQMGTKLTVGEAIGSKITSGIARVLSSPAEADKLQDGEIVITDLTSPDWDPILKKAAAIITNKGGRTSHASIVARELGVPAIVGTGDATEKIADGSMITVSCAEGRTGYVYQDKLEYQQTDIDFSNVKMPDLTEVMMIMADPEKAFKLSFYPNSGVGLMRIEFIITHFIQIHPMALVKFNELTDPAVIRQIETLTHGYQDKKQFFIEKLAQGIATIAAAFYPKDVIVRMSDFKTNEYANLLGGKDFEPHEENPMIGFRGASRYYDPRYREGFRLECEAIRSVRDEMGLNNVKVMIPFCRTIEEGEKVINVMQEFGLNRQKDKSLEIYVMAEIPANIIEGEDFGRLFDGFSIGSNDLTQLTLGIDRDSALVADLFTEQNKSVKFLIAMAIEKAKVMGRKIGLCGQAPSDFPEFAKFLVEKGINSISFSPDAILKGIENVNKAELKLRVDA
ncbi:phosphoenolpyruvate synthase [Flavitalea antarctica]